MRTVPDKQLTSLLRAGRRVQASACAGPQRPALIMRAKGDGAARQRPNIAPSKAQARRHTVCVMRYPPTGRMLRRASSQDD